MYLYEASMDAICPANPSSVRGPVLIEVIIYLVISATDVLCVPSITPWKPFWERGLCSFKRNVATAHDTQPKILKAMLQMECHISWYTVGIVGSYSRVHLEDVVLIDSSTSCTFGQGRPRRQKTYKTVELMGH